MSGEGRKSDFQWIVKRDVFTRRENGVSSNHKFRNFDLVEGQEWYLQLEHGPGCDGKTYVSLHLNLCPRRGQQPLRTKLKLGLIANDGEEKNVKSLCETFTDTRSRWGWDEFITLDSLLDERNGYFKNNRVAIFGRVEVCRSLEIPGSTLGNDLGHMLESGELSDFTLVVGGEELKLHKCVLSTRSPVFQAMFQHDMKEKKEGRLEIEDLDVVGVKGLVQFIYTGEVEGLSGIAEKVLPAANKYGVEWLKTMCTQELYDKLDAENVTDILVMADLYSAKQLKDQALDFIWANSAQVVKQAGFWKLLKSNEQLFKGVVRYGMTKMCVNEEVNPTKKPGNTSGTGGMAGLTTSQCIVLNTIIERENAEFGISVYGIMGHLLNDLSEGEILESLDVLSYKGYIHSTIDDGHYASTNGDYDHFAAIDYDDDDDDW